jgi:hypothetical protein
MGDHWDIRHFGNIAEVNAKAEIRIGLALIYRDSADSRPIEWELAADGRHGCHRAGMPASGVEGDPGTCEC